MPSRSEPNRFLRALFVAYALIWIGTAIAPRSWATWSLENLPVVLVVVVLAFTYRQFAFSNLSYLLITLFLTLHAIGAHTGYAQSPAGDWLKSAFHLRRNYYDRVVHCSFGLLLAYPVREILLRGAHVSSRAAGWFAALVVLAASAVFEVIEAMVAETVSPGTGPDWLGAQGDEWDSQLDMLVAAVGAVVAMLVTWWLNRRRRPTTGWRP